MKLISRMLAVIMIGALTGVVALAKVHKHKFTFTEDVKVNGTLVKKGTYDIKYDDESGQLSIVKHGKVVAQTMAKYEQRVKKANDFQVRAIVNGEETQLVGVTFGGSDKDVVITNNPASMSGNN